jgi:hypothetical protein
MALVHQGTIRADTAGRTITIAAANGVTHQGTLEVLAGATLAVTSSPLTQIAGTTRLDGGTLTVALGLDLAGGTLTGVGTITGSVGNAAACLPGSPTGTLTITGGYTQTAAGRLAVDLGGTAPGSFDGLAIGGAATLAGTLDLQIVGGYMPIVNDAFAILGYASRVGAFATVNGTSPGGGRTLVLSYGATAATVTVQ